MDYRVRHDELVDPLIAAYEQQIAGFFAAEALALYVRIHGIRKVDEPLTDEERRRAEAAIATINWDELRRLTVEWLIQAFSLGVLAAISMLGGSGISAYSLAINFAATRSAELVTGISEVTRGWLRAEITLAVANRLTPGDLATAIVSNQAFSPARALTIARTELAAAQSTGTLLAAIISGKVKKKKWMLADSHPRPDMCDGNAAEGWVPIDHWFRSGTDAPPAHPNCRCDIVLK